MEPNRKKLSALYSQLNRLERDIEETGDPEEKSRFYQSILDCMDMIASAKGVKPRLKQVDFDAEFAERPKPFIPRPREDD